MAKQTNDVDSQRKLFKDWFDEDAAMALAQQLRSVMPKFPSKQFIQHATKDIQKLEFAGRVSQFSRAMRIALPEDVGNALGIIRDSFPIALPDCESTTDGWLQWPVGQYIADHGLAHFDDSMLTMIELTQRFSSEFAVRPFVDNHQKETIAYLSSLTGHSSPHVRRWCSEGIRTRLPWGKKLNKLISDPKPIFPILEALKDDDELYVRRSVANNLNNVAKDHPGLVIARCDKWMPNSHTRAGNSQRETVVKQALRSLIKDGDKDALAVLGFGMPEKLICALAPSSTGVSIGGAIDLNATIESNSTKAQSLIVDYVVHYVRKNGTNSGKVFKWKTLDILPGEKLMLKKKQSFKKTSVRQLYLGHHQIELQINGQRMASTEVVLR
jgi:3-methyladenine DNA glycosylase AlkC